mgnify:CR=1 FL=1
MSSPATLTANDSDPDGDPLNILSVQSAVNGTVSMLGGQIVFTPTPNYNGPASFTYTVSDGHGGTDTATVNIQVRPVNDAPDAVDDYRTLVRDTTMILAPGYLTGNDTDPDGDNLSIISVQGAVNGSVSLSGGAVVFTPAPGFLGTASFTYTVSDGHGGSDTATVTLNVTTPPNIGPDAVNDSGLSTPVGTALTVPAGTLLGNDTDADGDPLSIISVQSAVNGSIALAGGNVVFTPTAGYSGPASFSYTISDGHGGTDTATVSLTVGVAANNHAPDAVDDGVLTVTLNTPLTIGPATLLGNDSDADGDPLSLISVQGAVHGSVGIVGGNIVFTPDAGYLGSASFTYSIDDGHGGSDTATVVLNVSASSAPIISIADNNGAQAGQLTVDEAALASGSNPASSAESASGSMTVSAPNGLVSIDFGASHVTLAQLNAATPATPVVIATPDGTLTLTHYDALSGVIDYRYTITSALNAAGASVTDSLLITAHDAASLSSTPVTFGATILNDAPIAGADTFSTTEGMAVSGSLAGNDTVGADLGGTWSLGASTPAHGTVVVNADGSFTYTPTAGFSGVTSFTYRASDGVLSSVTATVTLTVTPVSSRALGCCMARTARLGASRGHQSDGAKISVRKGSKCGPADSSSVQRLSK